MSTRGSVSLARHANTASPGPSPSPFLPVYFFFFVISLPDEARICQSSIRIVNPEGYSREIQIDFIACLARSYIYRIYIILCKRSTECYLLILPPLPLSLQVSACHTALPHCSTSRLYQMPNTVSKLKHNLRQFSLPPPLAPFAPSPPWQLSRNQNCK